VGGALGAVVLLGAGVLFWLYRRKRRNSENGTSAPVTPNQPMMYHQQQPGAGTPYSPTAQTPGSPQATPSVFGGMATSQHVPTSPHPSSWSGHQQLSQQYPTSPQQQQYLLPQQQQYPGPSQQAYDGYNRPVSDVSAAGLAPLPMWVERAAGRGGPSDAMSVTSAEHSAQHGAQPNVGQR
jgi:hypothetical protein